MAQAAEGQGNDAYSIAQRYKKDFWSKENLNFSEPHYRMEKAAQIIKNIAQDKERTLLDIGCGPAALARLLPANIKYYGIDMAIHDPAPNLLEADLLKVPIRFTDTQFDIVVAQGFFEYVGDMQSQKLAEIAALLKKDGHFIVTYWNYGHREKRIYFAHSNVQPMGSFHAALGRYFKVDRFFPASHNWHQGSPNRKLLKAVNMHVNVNIPLISSWLAVEYFFLCSPLGS